MSQKKIECPLCPWAAFERRHPKRSDTISAEIQMYEHLRTYHMDEVQRRMSESDDHHLR